jgi:hypothetical protein
MKSYVICKQDSREYLTGFLGCSPCFWSKNTIDAKKYDTLDAATNEVDYLTRLTSVKNAIIEEVLI